MVALHALADLGVTAWDFSTGLAVDLDSFAGRVTTSLKAEFAQQFRDDIRRKTREAMRYKAEQGDVQGATRLGTRTRDPRANGNGRSTSRKRSSCAASIGCARMATVRGRLPKP
jgi:DNA invertase Pin-like site-specific DNA recombinase